ncbi:uncharacterized protein LOC110108358 isoform X2 [Dendrobium catenatum]|uniref:uncharacterized protein LOC110108358 isoform X2 n=1 Tax=Dendrobium catenatum TaxID=906689 RepID=UPI0009F41716|nr:uncharacterized protein LOC110108358 isoform X2 [Dendrobium catenatum]
MTSRINGSMKRTKELSHAKQKMPNWVFIVGGALLSAFSLRLCCRLKQVFDFKRGRTSYAPSKENRNSTPNKRRETCKLDSQLYCFIPHEDICYQCLSGAKHTPTNPLSKYGNNTLQLVNVSSSQPSKENNGVVWDSVPDLLELPTKPFNHSNSLESPCLSESGSDIYSKREVIQKLRQQLKRRDDMIEEMQVQITDLQNSLTVEMAHTTHLQAQLSSSNHELLDSKQEIQRLRKTISNQFSCVFGPPENPLRSSIWLPEAANDFANGSLDGVEKIREEMIEMLKREVKELKEAIEGKEFLIQSYKEQKLELSSKLKELQLRLVSQALS